MTQKKSVAQVVNELVANQGVLFVKLHQYHWYVQRTDFFTLHGKFEELYNETSEHFDALAERLLAKGEQPLSTLKEYLEHATISESPYDQKVSPEDMISNIIDDFQTMIKLVGTGIELSNIENDSVTEDMLVAYKNGLDTTVWMLQAYLGKDVE